MRSDFVTANTVAYPTDYNSLVNDAAGSASLFAHNQLGFFTLSTNPTNGKTLTLTINGTAVVITFVTSIGASAGNLLIQATAALTAQALLSFLQNPTVSNANQVAIGVNTSVNVTLINSLDYALSGTTLTISSLNTLLNTPLTSFSGTTNATSDSYTAQTMQLYVEPGVFYIAGTRVIFAGGSTPTVTAPSSHPRIDVLSINSSGTLLWTTGAENVSPVAPTYPSAATNLVLCELFNVVGETQLLDNANQSATQGYVYNDVRPFQTPSMNWGAFPTDFIPDGDGTRNLGSASFEWNNVYAKTSIQVNGVGVAVAKFGGNGADGALSISSGTTTLSAGNAAVFAKNYSSISITGTGKLAFSNPNTNGTIIILKSQGGCTLTSSTAPMIDASAMGAAGGTAVTSSSNASGNVGKNGVAALISTNGGGAPTTSTVGTGGAIPSVISIPTIYFQALTKYPIAYVGGGGSSGAISNGGTSTTSGAGGTGGGCLIIECGGAWNFTTSGGISVAGANGGTSTEGSPSVAGGGGGGAGGLCIIMYGSLTANSGTITVAGGTGGNTGTSGSGQPRFGGAGGASVNAGNNGTSSSSASTKTGGDGGAGISLVAANTEFA
jgi:hypothetical protein